MIERNALNVSLTPELRAFVGELIGSGNFANHSEVVRAGPRLLRHEEEQLRAGSGRRCTTTPVTRA